MVDDIPVVSDKPLYDLWEVPSVKNLQRPREFTFERLEVPIDPLIHSI